MKEVKIKVQFDEQSKAVTAKAGIEVVSGEYTREDLDKVFEDSLYLFEKAFKQAQEYTMRK